MKKGFQHAPDERLVERAYLVGVALPNSSIATEKDHLKELEQLAMTAGAVVSAVRFRAGHVLTVRRLSAPVRHSSSRQNAKPLTPISSFSIVTFHPPRLVMSKKFLALASSIAPS